MKKIVFSALIGLMVFTACTKKDAPQEQEVEVIDNTPKQTAEALEDTWFYVGVKFEGDNTFERASGCSTKDYWTFSQGNLKSVAYFENSASRTCEEDINNSTYRVSDGKLMTTGDNNETYVFVVEGKTLTLTVEGARTETWRKK